jgi:hypothetical protein
LLPHAGAELVAADLDSGGVVDEVKSFLYPALNIVAGHSHVLHIINMHRLGGMRVAIIVEEDKTRRLTFPAPITRVLFGPWAIRH